MIIPNKKKYGSTDIIDASIPKLLHVSLCHHERRVLHFSLLVYFSLFQSQWVDLSGNTNLLLLLAVFDISYLY